MKRKFGTKFLILLLFSLGLTSIGYWLDSDPAVNLSTTILEFIMMTIMMFLIVSSFYFTWILIVRKAKKSVFKSNVS